MSPEVARTREELAVQNFLDQAPALLSAIESSYIISHRGHSLRQVPTFRPEELSLGAVLGTGGFGIVQEISRIILDKPDIDNSLFPHGDSNGNESDEDDDNAGPNDDPTSSFEEKQQQPQHYTQQSCDDSRKFMEKRVVRNGVARYALKRLHGNLSVIETARGIVDLAVEAKYLSVVNHPNIIRLRGIAKHDPLKPGFFLVLDRLYGTLDGKMNEWRKKYKASCGGRFLGLRKNKKILIDLLVDRMTVAYDLAVAMFYLHENRLVYRDIKPENIGFDVRGDAKIFDFGLCRSLTPELKSEKGYGYRLTGRAGSLPYMAPEVVKMEPYDTQCDVFSFSILLWEMLVLQPAFPDYSPTEFVEHVVTKQERLPVPTDMFKIPHLTRLALPQAWDPDPRKRPDMKRMAILIRADLNDFTSADNVLNRTDHMENQSTRSVDSTPC